MTEYKDLKMKYTENDIKEGTKLRCTKTIPEWWQLGKVYTVSLNDGILQITDDNGDGAYTDFMLDCLNGNYTTLSFEIVEE
ncbi:tail length tape-measure protein [Enterococcus phage vB_EfaS-271]|nr:tail length tape-measure protein [Enterococcus phage vB_EfaS-271]